MALNVWNKYIIIIDSSEAIRILYYFWALVLTNFKTFFLNTSISFGWINYSVVIIYMLIVLGVGFYFSKRQKSTDDYFKGGGRIPWWAAGISIFGTVLSAISFMAIPAKTFATDWTYLLNALGPVFVAPLIIIVFLPYYERLNVTSAYAFLEQRFNLTIRLLGSAFFMIFQIGRVSIILLLPAIALNVVAGFNIHLSIFLMAGLSIVYTMKGGIEGVIWTDVLQVLVLIGGVITAICWILIDLNMPISELLAEAKAQGKFKIVDLHFSLKEPTLWVVLFGGIFSNLAFYGSDQTVVQRYITSNNKGDSTRSVWTNAALILPATVLFFFLGTLLFIYYHYHPDVRVDSLSQMDAIFPLFIVTQLPQGVAGLLIAGLFAAAMSSVSSSLNSISTAYTIDFHRRLLWKGSELKIARISTLVSGILCLLIALLLGSLELRSTWDAFLKMVGLLTGSLGGLFVLGMLTKRVGSKAALWGFIASSVLQFVLSYTDAVHLLLFAFTGFVSTYIFALIFSLFWPAEERAA